MGGTIGVESEPGKGSRFFFEMPLDEAKQGKAIGDTDRARFVGARAESSVASWRLSAGASVQALVVDDVAENRELLRQMLESIGCQVRVASSGEEALGKLREIMPDIVFLDIRMPGMDGIQTAQAMRAVAASQEAGLGRAELPLRLDEMAAQQHRPINTSSLSSAAPGGGSRSCETSSKPMPSAGVAGAPPSMADDSVQGKPSRPRPLQLVAVSASVLEHERKRYFEAGFDDFISKPIRLDQLCVCLTDRLGAVIQTLAVGEPGSTCEGELDLHTVTLPAGLRQRLRTAAQHYSTTEFRECLREVEQCGVPGQRLAARLQELIRRYAIEDVLRLLDELEKLSLEIEPDGKRA
jgi:CheY-like chemotaxis protein